MILVVSRTIFFFFFNDTATTEIYTLSLHDALPISGSNWAATPFWVVGPLFCVVGLSFWVVGADTCPSLVGADRKSTRLNSSHANISYAVFCLKKKKNTRQNR